MCRVAKTDAAVRLLDIPEPLRYRRLECVTGDLIAIYTDHRLRREHGDNVDLYQFRLAVAQTHPTREHGAGL
jgi:hypothetical protein